MSIRNELLELIRDAMFNILGNTVVSGRGGIGLGTSYLLGTINTTPTTITNYDREVIVDTKNITQLPLTNDGLIFLTSGVWVFYIKLTLTFDELNAGRSIALRVWNATDAEPASGSISYFVGRNTAGANLDITIPIDLQSSQVGDLFQLQVLTDGDTFSNVSVIEAAFSTVHASEAK